MKTEQLKIPTYGGQALIEGALMRGSKYGSSVSKAGW